MFARKRLTLPVATGLGLVVLSVVLSLMAALLAAGSGGPGPGTSARLDEALLALVYLPFVIMGALVVSRQPRNGVGWAMLLVGVGANLAFFIQEYAYRAIVAAPGSLPFGPAFAWVSYWIWMVTLAGMLWTVLLFPNGRLASRRWRPLAWGAALLMTFVMLVFAFTPAPEPDVEGVVNPLAIEALRPLGEWVEDSFWMFLIIFVLAVASVIARFRASRGVERQQLKWGAGGCAFAAVLLAISNYVQFGIVSDVGWMVAITAIPVSFAIAILRHGLYEIDVLINRALVYGALSALLLSTYVISVLALTALLRPLTGSGDVAVAGSTLAVLALFQPLRARIQRFVDRRFYRARYDAARTIDRFGARLREQVDLDQLKGELIGVVDETIKPAHASLWLRR